MVTALEKLKKREEIYGVGRFSSFFLPEIFFMVLFILFLLAQHDFCS